MAVINLTNNDDLWEVFQNGNAFESNTINGMDGNDFIVSGTQDDIINGGNGDDILFGISGNDILNGDAGDDILDGGNGSDILNGGTGDDTYLLEFPESEFGQDEINDVDGDGTIEIGSTQFDANTGQTNQISVTFQGSPVLNPNPESDYTLTLGSDIYYINWSGVDGDDLTFWGNDAPQAQVSAVIKNFSNNSFGLTFSDTNAAPVANDDSATTDENQAIIIDVLGNDTDADENIDQATVTIVNQPENGTVSVNSETGEVTYTPNAEFNGNDSFTYTIQDNDGEISNEATVSIVVEDTAIVLTYNPDFWEAFQQGLGFADNEIYALDGNDVIISGNGNDYIEGGDGDDSLFGVGGNDVILGGDGNDLIDAANGDNIVEGGAGVDTYLVEFTDLGSTEVTDTDGNLFVGVFNQQTFQLEGFALAGEAELQNDGNYILEVGGNLFNLEWDGNNGSDLIITDANNENSHSLIIKNFNNDTYGLDLVLPNAAPVANDDSATTDENQAIIIDVLGNDTDSDGNLNPATVTIVNQPENGTVSVNSETGEITYTPDGGYDGTDSFTYNVQDNEGAVSNEATVTLTINDNDTGNGTINLTNNDDVWSASNEGLYFDEINLNALDGNDTITSGNQDDTIDAGNGDDNVYSGRGDDVVIGGEGVDDIRSSWGDDEINSGAGNDDVRGSWGDDNIIGGTGNDTIRGGWDNDTIDAGNGDDYVRGGWGNDEIHGNSGNDTIRGGWGNDFIFGDSGDDIIRGGFGDDELTGGTGNDTFIFSENWGNDSITDFEQGSDLIQLEGISFNEITITSNDSGSTVEYAGSQILIAGVTVDSDDFI